MPAYWKSTRTFGLRFQLVAYNLKPNSLDYTTGNQRPKRAFPPFNESVFEKRSVQLQSAISQSKVDVSLTGLCLL